MDIEMELTEAERELAVAIKTSEKYKKAMEEVMEKLSDRVVELKEKILEMSTQERLSKEIARLEWNLSTMPKGDEVCPESALESIKKIKAQSNYEILVKRKSLEAELEKLKKFMTG